jgi:hypothetical protein
MHPRVAKDMSLDIEGRDDLLYRIGKEVIYRSHKKKIEEMAGWEETPFTTGNYKLLPCGRGANEFKITEIPRSVPCASCNTKSSNKQCKHSCCKKCCLDKQEQGQEACKSHKLVIVATTPRTADNSSFEDGYQSNEGGISDEDGNED